MATSAAYVGVDVGTASVRALLLASNGRPLAHHTRPLTVGNPGAGRYQQRGGEVWAAVCECVKAVASQLPASHHVAGIGFDATCSLVVLDDQWQPLTVDASTGDACWNIIMWMDHRATAETALVNSKPRRVLRAVGGTMSPEMQVPKLLWLKRHLPDTWAKAAHFLDLPDFLTAKATGKMTRSLCSLVCKWTYGREGEGGTGDGWDEAFLRDVGLEDLITDNFSKIGAEAVAPGRCVGGVGAEAAAELGLPPGTPVGASLIDAHAGALALLGASGGEGAGVLAVVSGTSSCHLLSATERREVPGVWGPYRDVILPGKWVTEAGQTATGALLDHLLDTHPLGEPGGCRQSLIGRIEHTLARLAAREGLADSCELTRQLHVYPDHHGNRAPLADPSMRGAVCGLSLDAGIEDLAVKYLATVQAIAYGCRDIVARLRSYGHRVDTLLLCGGLAQSELVTRTHADALGVSVGVPEEQQLSVVRGAAMVGAAAACGGELVAVMTSLAASTHLVQPREELRPYHDAKFRVFQRMQRDQQEYRAMMAELPREA